MSTKFNFKPLVNVRTQKDEMSENVIATSVTGNFRFPPKAARIVGIADYDALTVFSHEDEETKEVRVFLGKGHKGTILRDENGIPVTGVRNTTEFTEEDPMDGAIVRETTSGSKILSVTSAAAWKTLGGAKDKEIELKLVSMGEMEYPLPSGTIVEGEVFELVIIKERAIKIRQKHAKKDGEAETDVVSEAYLETEEGFEEEEV
jgi:hypothetical protein